MVTGAWVASSIPNPDTCPMAPTDKTNISESQISHLWKAFMMSPYRATERTNEAQVKASPELSTPLSAGNQYPFPFPWWQPWVCDELSAFSQGLLSVAPASHGRWQFTLRFLGVGSDFKGLLFSNCPLSLFEFFSPIVQSNITMTLSFPLFWICTYSKENLKCIRKDSVFEAEANETHTG